MKFIHALRAHIILSKLRDTRITQTTIEKNVYRKSSVLNIYQAAYQEKVLLL